METPFIPKLQALVLADHIYQDKRTDKMVIAGTFTCLWAGGFPSDLGRPTYAYVSLRDFQGSVDLDVRYVDLADQSVLMETRFQASSSDRLATAEFVIEVPSLPMPRAGTYAFEIHSADHMIGSVRLSVRKKEGATDGH